MKKILITGAAGVVGAEVLRSLLTEGKYEISVIDLPNLKTKELFKKYKNRVNVLYGDLTDQSVVEELVKDHDIIIHLATILPTITSINEEIAKITELNVTENFVRAINYYNPKCYFIYASTSAVYGDKLKSYNVSSKTITNTKNYYTRYKIKSENVIKDKLSNYTIVRLPLVLSKLKGDNFIYNIKLDSLISTITKEDAGYLFAKVIEKHKKYNQKIINASGNEKFNIIYKDLLKALIKANALSPKMIFSLAFVDKNYCSTVLSDSAEFNNDLNYQNDDINNYFNRIKYNNQRKYFSKYFGKVILKIWEKRK